MKHIISYLTCNTSTSDISYLNIKLVTPHNIKHIIPHYLNITLVIPQHKTCNTTSVISYLNILYLNIKLVIPHKIKHIIPHYLNITLVIPQHKTWNTTSVISYLNIRHFIPQHKICNYSTSNLCYLNIKIIKSPHLLQCNTDLSPG